MSEVVTVRIDKRTKQKIKEHNINVSETLRNALKLEIEKREEKELAESLEKAGNILRKVNISRKEIVRVVRESRDER